MSANAGPAAHGAGCEEHARKAAERELRECERLARVAAEASLGGDGKSTALYIAELIALRARQNARETTAARPDPGRRPSRYTDPQPPPAADPSMPAVWDLVKADFDQRDCAGLAKYGTRLQPHNGRDVLVDLYQELLDAVVYLRQELYERDGR